MQKERAYATMTQRYDSAGLMTSSTDAVSLDSYEQAIVSLFRADGRALPTIERALAAVKGGTFKPEDYGQYSLMKFKGSELAPLGTFASKVPPDLQAKVKAKEKDILDGKFKVAVVETEPKSTAK